MEHATTSGIHNDEPLFSAEDLHFHLTREGCKFEELKGILLSKNLLLRPLQSSDFKKGYMELLAQHTRIGTVNEQLFLEQFRVMKSYGNIYYIVVIEDLVSSTILATGTLEIEHKFIHSAALRGRLEDVVVDRESEHSGYRYSTGNLASVILEVLTTLGKALKCYKISLESEDHLLDFYGTFGYKADKGQNYMVVRFRD